MKPQITRKRGVQTRRLRDGLNTSRATLRHLHRDEVDHGILTCGVPTTEGVAAEVEAGVEVHVGKEEFPRSAGAVGLDFCHPEAVKPWGTHTHDEGAKKTNPRGGGDGLRREDRTFLKNEKKRKRDGRD
jgi:hypothetical protein